MRQPIGDTPGASGLRSTLANFRGFTLTSQCTLRPQAPALRAGVAIGEIRDPEYLGSRTISCVIVQCLGPLEDQRPIRCRARAPSRFGSRSQTSSTHAGKLALNTTELAAGDTCFGILFSLAFQGSDLH
jgi:hypothetical protein